MCLKYWGRISDTNLRDRRSEGQSEMAVRYVHSDRTLYVVVSPLRVPNAKSVPLRQPRDDTLVFLREHLHEFPRKRVGAAVRG